MFNLKPEPECMVKSHGWIYTSSHDSISFLHGTYKCREKLSILYSKMKNENFVWKWTAINSNTGFPLIFQKQHYKGQFHITITEWKSYWRVWIMFLPAISVKVGAILLSVLDSMLISSALGALCFPGSLRLPLYHATHGVKNRVSILIILI